MAIPASVLFYTNWEHGSLVSTTYTQATPEIPNAHTWTFAGTIDVDSGSPWNGQSLANFTEHWSKKASTVVSSATASTTSGRLLVEVDETADASSTVFRLAGDGVVLLASYSAAGDLIVYSHANGAAQTNEINMDEWPDQPFALEIIYEFDNATADQRLRARAWTVGGTPGSFVDSTSTFGNAANGAEFTALALGYNDGFKGKIGRFILSNSITEDLSAVTESDAVTGLPRRALDGPFYGALRGSVR
jgi:hypothetical protein